MFNGTMQGPAESSQGLINATWCRISSIKSMKTLWKLSLSEGRPGFQLSHFWRSAWNFGIFRYKLAIQCLSCRIDLTLLSASMEEMTAAESQWILGPDILIQAPLGSSHSQTLQDTILYSEDIWKASTNKAHVTKCHQSAQESTYKKSTKRYYWRESCTNLHRWLQHLKSSFSHLMRQTLQLRQMWLFISASRTKRFVLLEASKGKQ